MHLCRGQWTCELILGANPKALKHMKQNAKKTAICVTGNAHDIPQDNSVPRDHPVGRNKIQDNYKSELCIFASKHQVLNVYKILQCVGPMCLVNWQQLFDLKKSCLGNTDPVEQSPDTNLALISWRKIHRINLPLHIIMLSGTRLEPAL